MMKKLYFILSLTLLLSCAKDKYETPPETAPPPQLTTDEYRAIVALKPHHTISFNEAKQQALEAASLFDNGTQTKAAPKGILNGLAITANSIGLTKSEALEVDTLIYLFNYANDEGYVFISADERAPGILAYIEDGYFNIQDSIECPGAVMLFSGMEVLVRQEIDRAEFLKDSLGAIAMAKYAAITRNGGLDAKGADGSTGNHGSVVSVTQKITYIKHAPDNQYMVKTNWGQTAPFHNLLPILPNNTHAYVGCDAVAVAQIIAHFNYPQSFNGIPINTSKLRQYKNREDFSTPFLENDIARFNKFVFDNVIKEYDESGSTGDYEHDRDFLRALGYSTPWQTVHYNFGDIKTSIDSKWLVFARGDSHRTNNFLGIIYSYSGGHAWIIDHYAEVTKAIHEVTAYSNGTTSKRSVSSETKMYVHCNMGWSKSKNGYYIDGVFDTRTIPEVKTKSQADYNYQYNVHIAPRIR